MASNRKGQGQGCWVPRCPGQPPTPRVIWPWMSAGLRWRHPDLELWLSGVGSWENPEELRCKRPGLGRHAQDTGASAAFLSFFFFFLKQCFF